MTVVEAAEPLLGIRTRTPRTRARWHAPALDAVVAVAGVAVVMAIGLELSVSAAVALPVVWLALLHRQSAFRIPAFGDPFAEQRDGVVRAAVGAGALAFAAEATIGLGGTPTAWLLALLAASAGSVGHRFASSRINGSRACSVIAVGEVGQMSAVLDGFQRSPQEVAVAEVLAVADGHLDPDSVIAAVARTGADTVVVVPPVPPAELRRLGWHLAETGTGLCVATPLDDVTPARTALASAGPTRLLEVRPAGHPVARVLKHCGERSVAAVLLLAAAPVLLALMLAIRLDSPGPAIFRQQRVGRDGRLFTMLKLRTMCAHAEQTKADLAEANEADGVLFKVRNDPRITRIGAFLRRFSLDELPQLVNVVRGDMALVGPRPALPDEVARYDVDPRRRLAVRPGLTGLWQVSGRSDLSWEESVRLDVAYVDNWTLGLDLSILRRTFRAVLGQRGAY